MTHADTKGEGTRRFVLLAADNTPREACWENRREQSTEYVQAPIQKYAPSPNKKIWCTGKKWKKSGKVDYVSCHERVRRLRGRPQHCEHCDSTDPGKRYEWANISGKFKDANDYIRLCTSCHRKWDLSRSAAPVSCLICRKEFAMKMSLIFHTRTHANKRQRSTAETLADRQAEMKARMRRA